MLLTEVSLDVESTELVTAMERSLEVVMLGEGSLELDVGSADDAVESADVLLVTASLPDVDVVGSDVPLLAEVMCGGSETVLSTGDVIVSELVVEAGPLELVGSPRVVVAACDVVTAELVMPVSAGSAVDSVLVEDSELVAGSELDIAAEVVRIGTCVD